MTDSIAHLLCLSTPVTFRCTPGPYADHLLELLTALTVSRPSDRSSPVIMSLETDRGDAPRFVGTVDGERFVATDSAPDFVRLVLWQLNRLASQGSGDLLLHAGVVARNGRAVLLAGGSGSGKSTLVARLVLDGFDYLSDEIGSVQANGLIRPYPRPLSLRAGSFTAMPDLAPVLPATLGALREGSWHLPPDAMRAGCVGSAAAIDLIAFVRYQPGASVEARPVRRAEAVARLLEQRLESGLAGGGALRRLAGATNGVRCYEIEFGNLDEAASAIIGVMAPEGDSIFSGRRDRTSRRSR